MARMIPALPFSFNGSSGEEKLYNEFKKLSDDYTIFHSIPWTMRSGQGTGFLFGEVDFAIFHPDKGILLIEVKSGGVKYQDGEFYGLEQGQWVPRKDPWKQMEYNKYLIIEKIRLTGKKCWVCSSLWFTDVEHIKPNSLPLNLDENTVLLKGNLTNVNKAIDSVFTISDAPKRTSLLETDKQAIIECIAPTFKAIPSSSNLIEEREKIFIQMTQEQYSILDFLEEQNVAAINGCAGTGKTLLALEKSRRLADSGDKVLLLCFNTFLREFLQSPINAHKGITVHSIFSLATELTGKNLIEENEIAYLILEYSKRNFPYDSIVIDEGQDFPKDCIEALESCTRKSFYVFFDKNQLVQKDRLPEWLEQAECRLKLHKNCRNTKQIAETVARSIKIKDMKLPPYPIDGIQKPVFKIVSSDQTRFEIKKLLKRIIGSGIKKNRIAILTVRTNNDSRLMGVERLGEYLITTSPGKEILFTTIRKFKGLEADAVILIDITADTFKSEQMRRDFYVGVSRAKQVLYIIADMSLEEATIVANIIAGVDENGNQIKTKEGFGGIKRELSVDIEDD
jgi:Cdc6-like AAA superfamily ATPase